LILADSAWNRSASCVFSWNSENAWLWRHKVAAFAKRNGVADLDGMRRAFGPHWAYRRCREILAEPLDGIVFPSESAAMKALDTDMLMARYKAQQIIEKLQVNRTELVQNESFNGWPVWAVPASFGEAVAETPLNPGMLRQGRKERGNCDCTSCVWKLWMTSIWAETTPIDAALPLAVSVPHSRLPEIGVKIIHPQRPALQRPSLRVKARGIGIVYGIRRHLGGFRVGVIEERLQSLDSFLRAI